MYYLCVIISLLNIDMDYNQLQYISKLILNSYTY